MKNQILMAAAAVGAAFTLAAQPAQAQDKFKVTGKIDFVSDYVWRGMYQNSGFSVQPTLGLSYKGFTLSAWGSQSLTNAKDAPQEVDLALNYANKGWSVTVTDYWWDGMYAPYGHYKDGHHFEAQLSYNFSAINEKVPLTLSWGTMFAGGDQNSKGDRAASTYITASYDVACPYDITLTPAVGFTPWDGMYHNKAAFTDISLKASKSIEVTDKFSIPLFVQTIVAPQADKVYLLGGLSIGF